MNTSNNTSKDNDSSLEQPNQLKAIRCNATNCTLEEKIVAAVWYHERVYTGMSDEQLEQNYLIRFKKQFPKCDTLRKWECQLFGDGHLSSKPRKNRSTLGRLVYVPYVKESLIRYPNLTVQARANLLGISVHTLAKIFRKDLKKEVSLNREKCIDNNEADVQTEMSVDLVRNVESKGQ